MKEIKIGNKRTKLLLKILSLCVIVTIILGGVSLAMFIGENMSDKHIIKPEGFYFASDSLQEGTAMKHEMNNWNTSKDYTVILDIRNWQDSLRSSSIDIDYTLSVDDASLQIQVNDTTISNGGTLHLSSSSETTDKVIITVPSGHKPANNKFKVTAVAKPSTAGTGFTQTMYGEFSLNEKTTTFDAELEKHNNYIDIRIGVAGETNVAITWPSWVTIDTTDQLLSNVTGKNTTFHIAQDSSHIVRFFVTDTIKESEYFTVTANGRTARIDVLGQISN